MTTNPPLDFQQNPVELVKDALRVARAATEATEILSGKGAFPTDEARRTAVLATLDYAHKFDPPFTIALMEDWLRLREQMGRIQTWSDSHQRRLVPADSCLDTIYRLTIESLDRAALAKQG